MSYQVINHPSNKGDPVRAPGTLTLTCKPNALDVPSTVSRLGSSVPKQALKMIGYRVQLKDDATAIALGKVLLDLSLIDSYSMVDDVSDSPTITLLLGDKAITVNQNPGKILMMNSESGTEISISVRDGSGNLLPPGDLISLTVEFQRDFIQA